MNEASGQQKSQLDDTSAFAEPDGVPEQQVAVYLAQHPEFFVKHPALLEQLQLPHAQKGSVSLVERQSEQLRQKVRLLNTKLSQLIGIAKQNEAIYRIYADLNLRVLKCTDISSVQFVLEDVMQEQLNLSSVALKPYKGAFALPEIQRKLFAEKRFKDNDFFFGRLSEHEKKLLFSDQQAESVALLRLGDNGELGILAIGSNDPGHFNPDMDTLLITQLQQFLSILLPKLLAY
ncbi:DUF484 family protein [Paraglaciecola chathamensis]|uniref:DUF484 family protein n=1 Tax=Paraglaciecola chathamensis TaxID=368405 RepID=UPI0026F7E87E|nr:DUF484 family protein [Paraglaciecola chathamensis]MDO6560674.1 DUF484 family protein [Paraglaciecola chathamensis]